MRKLIPYITNKYLITALVFVAIVLFIDRNNVFMQYGRRAELRSLEQKRDFYLGEIKKTEQQLYELQHSSEALEKYARENLLMKRENEDLFLVEPPLPDSVVANE